MTTHIEDVNKVSVTRTIIIMMVSIAIPVGLLLIGSDREYWPLGIGVGFALGFVMNLLARM